MKLIVFLLAAGIPASASQAAAPAVAAETARRAPEIDKELRAAQEAIASLEEGRLYKDKAYAQAILLHAERLAPRVQDMPETAAHVLLVRLIALRSLDRDTEALALSQTAADGGATEPIIYAIGFYAAAAVGETEAALRLVEAAAQKVAPEGRTHFREAVETEFMRWLWQGLGGDSNPAKRHRLAEALLRLDYAEADDVVTRDSYRRLAIDSRLEAGQIAAARTLAEEIVHPESLAALLVAKRYDPLFPAAVDRPQLIRTAVTRFDAATRARLEAAPADVTRLLDRGQALRTLGRDQEAADLLLPFAADMKRVEAGGEQAFWIVNEAAYALGALGRHDEAVALMEKVTAPPADADPSLISVVINHGEVLNSAGRFAQAAAHEAKLTEETKAASPFGHMWMWSIAACAHALAGEPARAAPWLAKLAKNSAANQTAHMRALLCANDLDAAEKLLIARLQGKRAASVLLNLQTYQPASDHQAIHKLLDTRMLALKERPAVREAIAGVGRILSLPFPRRYWGDY
jgi:tetratricopeptide (TPR) repeat protein